MSSSQTTSDCKGSKLLDVQAIPPVSSLQTTTASSSSPATVTTPSALSTDALPGFFASLFVKLESFPWTDGGAPLHVREKWLPFDSPLLAYAGAHLFNAVCDTRRHRQCPLPSYTLRTFTQCGRHEGPGWVCFPSASSAVTSTSPSQSELEVALHGALADWKPCTYEAKEIWLPTSEKPADFRFYSNDCNSDLVQYLSLLFVYGECWNDIYCQPRQLAGEPLRSVLWVRASKQEKLFKQLNLSVAASDVEHKAWKYIKWIYNGASSLLFSWFVFVLRIGNLLSAANPKGCGAGPILFQVTLFQIFLIFLL